ncbi:hypothetical protein CF336_g1230 [Tilletia laevis]|uniref:BZIP domain-containing protein n=1 Tax=Tilletia caries TaxID=13290 RepID=A0A8T8TUE2_9BASI|nr:hypothetical protein CF336_g1230 [Tilletia laevis]KAE8206671.1 hypothetical protein CF335_g1704 [Tilletia laevis]KAE8265611.1 hypothetical protein A4X03_0g138 [Tilletia caries]CAD6906481.1 unnamed protein product [Tilletia caries]
MARGRRPNLELPVTPSLNAQRAFRERKRQHLTDLEDSVQRLTNENEELKRKLRSSSASASSSSSSSSSPAATAEASTQTDDADRSCRHCTTWSEAYTNVSADLSRLRIQLSGLVRDQHQPSSSVPARPSFQAERPNANGSASSPSFVPPAQPLSLSYSLLAASPKHSTSYPPSTYMPYHKRQRTESSSSLSAQYNSSFVEPAQPRTTAQQSSSAFPSSANWWTTDRIASTSRVLGAAQSSNRSSSTASTLNNAESTPSPTYASTAVADDKSTSPKTSGSDGLCCVEEAALATGVSPTLAAKQGCGGSLRQLCNVVSASSAEHRAKMEQVRSQQLSALPGVSASSNGQSNAESRRWSGAQGLPYPVASSQYQSTVPGQLSLPSLPETLGTNSSNKPMGMASLIFQGGQQNSSYSPSYQKPIAPIATASSEIGAANAIRSMSRSSLAVDDMDPQRPDSRQQQQQQQQGMGESLSTSYWPSAPSPAAGSRPASKQACSQPSGCGPRTSVSMNATPGASSACGSVAQAAPAPAPTTTATATDSLGFPSHPITTLPPAPPAASSEVTTSQTNTYDTPQLTTAPDESGQGFPELKEDQCCYGLVECDDQGRVIF